MGNSSSSTTVNDMISTIISSQLSTVSDCHTALSNNQSITVVDNNGTVNLGEIDWTQYVQVNMNCVQQNVTSQDIVTQISAQAKTAADAINQNLSLNPASTSATNITNITERLAVAVVVAFSQTCAVGVSNSQSLNIMYNGPTGVVNATAIKWDQYIESATKCCQTNNEVVQLKSELMDKIDAEASSTVQFLGNFGFLIALVICVFFISISQGVSKLFDPKVMASIAFLLCLYFTVAYSWKGKPYQRLKSQPCNTPCYPPYPAPDDAVTSYNEKTTKTDKVILVGSIVGMVVTGLLAVRLARTKSSTTTNIISARPAAH